FTTFRFIIQIYRFYLQGRTNIYRFFDYLNFVLPAFYTRFFITIHYRGQVKYIVGYKFYRVVMNMKILLVLGSIVFPIVMFILRKKWGKLHLTFNLLAIISALIFGNIASISIYNILVDNTVFMTKIHAIFLNPFFLITGSYLGVYILYLLLIFTIDNRDMKGKY